MQNKNDSDWKFIVRLYGFAAHSRISRGLRHVLLVLHSWACLLMGHIKKCRRPENHKSRSTSKWPGLSWTPSIVVVARFSGSRTQFRIVVRCNGRICDLFYPPRHHRRGGVRELPSHLTPPSIHLLDFHQCQPLGEVRRSHSLHL